MPVAPTYPGVYIQEIPSGVRTITGVATSITAFLGRTPRGPVNEPTSVFSFADFERQFGGLWVTAPMTYAVRDFYVNGGSQGLIVRIFSPTFADETARQAAKTAATDQAQTAAAAVAKAASDAAGAAGATPQSVAAAASGAVAAASAPGPASASAANAVAAAASDAAGAAGATPQSVSTAAGGAVTGAVSAAAASPRVKAQLTVNGLGLEAASEGAWGNQLRARVTHSDSSAADVIAQLGLGAFGVTQDQLFNLTVKDMGTGQVETFLNVNIPPTVGTFPPSPQQLDLVLKDGSNLVRAFGSLPTTRPDAQSDTPDKGKTIWDDNGTATSTGVSGDGTASDGNGLADSDYTGDQTNKKGLYALDKADLFNLLCIPPDSPNGNTSNSVYSDSMSYCVPRRAMLLVDSPHDWSDNPDTAASSAVTGLGGLGLTGTDARNAALYFPRVIEADPKRNGQLGRFVPCGIIAGVMARTDTSRGVWKAPAGLDASLNGTQGLDAILSDSENGQLNPFGINVLRSFPVYGRVAWGARTLRGADQIGDDYKYVPVRRLALYIEESLYRGTQWVVFEPNDEPLWAQIRLNVGAFMQNLFRQGAFQGKSPTDAYFVKCDSESTIQNDINLGIVNIVVGFAPLKPAEFVIIQIQQMAGQIQV